MTARSLLLLLAGLVSGAFHSQAAAYLKLGDIKGEVTRAPHTDWCALLAFSHRIHLPALADPTGVAAAPVHEPFVITKELDAASPKIVESFCAAKSIPLVEMHQTVHFGDSEQVYLAYELKNVMVTSYQLSANASSTSVPTEEFSLNYEEIKVTYTRFDPTGRPVGTVTAICKAATAKS